MDIYKILSNGIFSRKSKTGTIQGMSFEPVVSLRREEFSSDVIVPISNEILDTEDSLMIEKYRSNLKILIDKAFKEGKVDNFRLIREDDFFPYDWVWRVNSIDTGREYAKSTLAYTLRMEEARNHLKQKYGETPYYFEIPFSSEEELQEAKKLGKNFGKVYEPVKFRSTKHFTINTPLSYTGNYNQVESDRKFIIIDKVDDFCKSGYGYSSDYPDAYMDITHEGLPISRDAIVLIRDELYPEIIKDERIASSLKERKVVRYRGDEATAINMVLSEEGVLPYRMGRYYEMNSDLETIFRDSMIDFCNKHHLEYAHNHGNLFGKGGHFSDLLDSENRERRIFEEEFCSYLGREYPDYAGLFTTTFYHYPQKIVKAIGTEKVLRGIAHYNEDAKMQEKKLFEEYVKDRDTITPEIHDLFVDVLECIKKYYSEEHDYNEYLHKQILKFFHGRRVDDQVMAAREIQEILKSQKTMSS